MTWFIKPTTLCRHLIKMHKNENRSSITSLWSMMTVSLTNCVNCNLSSYYHALGIWVNQSCFLQKHNYFWIHKTLKNLLLIRQSNLGNFLDSKVHGPTRGPSGADRTLVGHMLAPCTLLSGLWGHRSYFSTLVSNIVKLNWYRGYKFPLFSQVTHLFII